MCIPYVVIVQVFGFKGEFALPGDSVVENKLNTLFSRLPEWTGRVSTVLNAALVLGLVAAALALPQITN
ncbi:MAG: hypothetical protein AAB734_02995 [Patescibacteria group bacterium]